MLPEPPSEPDDRLTMGEVSEPVIVKAPPLMPSAVPALMLKRPETPSAPPDSVMFSSESTFCRLKLPDVIVTVWLPATLMRTRCPAVGALPVLQLLPVDQSPLPPIQQSSTAHPVARVKVAVVAP